ncbi:hypothetical protein ACLB2K_072482 [Fragaria x ananassa]
MILKVVKQRSEVSHEKDLLQMILQVAETSGENGLSHKKFIIDNCKTIFIAAYETTAVAATWSLMLLALHPDWQARVRAEVLEICGDKPLHADMLPSMKVLTMVIQEVMRLYSPVFFLAREVFETITLKNVVIPKGVVIQIPIPFLHQDPDIWGPDAHKFNPERFANGVLKACNSPQAYMPFGLGPRICVGQHLAMTELKHTNIPLLISSQRGLNMVSFSVCGVCDFLSVKSSSSVLETDASTSETPCIELSNEEFKTLVCNFASSSTCKALP